MSLLVSNLTSLRLDDHREKINGFHEGERKLHSLLHLPPNTDPTIPYLSQSASQFLSISATLLALGTLDTSNRPWTSIVGGEPGFTRGLSQKLLAISSVVGVGDPIFDNLGNGGKKMISGLGMDLAARRRVKLFGTVDEAMRRVGDGKVQMVIEIEQSLGNCPKYLNTHNLYPAEPNSSAVVLTHLEKSSLGPEELAVVSTADLFFISTISSASKDMDTNIRGGPPGFVRIVPSLSPDTPTTIIWPDYSGNRLYHTLGNLMTNPTAGLTFPDFVSGNILYLTGRAEVLIGKDADEALPRCTMAIKFTVSSFIFAKDSLLMREKGGPSRKIGYSPYNPTIRYLAAEKPPPSLGTDDGKLTCELLEVEELAPTVKKFTFKLDGEAQWKAGQYVALDFSKELAGGYRHMDDGDPKGLNDDYIRTFTITSLPPPPSTSEAASKSTIFNLILRNVHGPVTSFLFRPRPANKRLTIPIKGFGGDFFLSAAETAVSKDALGQRVINYIAAGVGITPLLPQVQHILEEDPKTNINLFWTARWEDWGLVMAVRGLIWDLQKRRAKNGEGVEGQVEKRIKIHIYLTGIGKGDMRRHVEDKVMGELNDVSAAVDFRIELRRMQRGDFLTAPGKGEGQRKEDISVEGAEGGTKAEEAEAGTGQMKKERKKEKWFICTGPEMRKEVSGWLVAEKGEGVEVVWEEFGY